MDSAPLWFRLVMLAWSAFAIYVGTRPIPPEHKRTHAQRRTTALLRPIVVIAGASMALWALLG